MAIACWRDVRRGEPDENAGVSLPGPAAIAPAGGARLGGGVGDDAGATKAGGADSGGTIAGGVAVAVPAGREALLGSATAAADAAADVASADAEARAAFRGSAAALAPPLRPLCLALEGFLTGVACHSSSDSDSPASDSSSSLLTSSSSSSSPPPSCNAFAFARLPATLMAFSSADLAAAATADPFSANGDPPAPAEACCFPASRRQAWPVGR